MTAVDLVRRIQSTIKEEKLLAKGDKIVVAVSGGADSVALLHVLVVLAQSWDWTLIAAHVNHQFRIAESQVEATQVNRLADRLGVPFAYAAIDVPAYALQSGMNAQAAAREKRYEFLHEVAANYGANKIALAHHADDQAETVLMRIIQGTGLLGLAGIPIKRTEKNVQLVRPLLRNTKQELENYCRIAGLAYCTDSSNLQRKYVRNHLRLDVLPLLSAINSEIRDALNRLAEQAKADGELLDELALKSYAQIVEQSQGECVFARISFLPLPVALQRRLIKLILSYLAEKSGKFAASLRFSDFKTIEAVRNAVLRDAPTTLQMDVGGNVRFIREYERIRFVRTNRAASFREFAYRIAAAPARVHVPEAGCALSFEVLDPRAVDEEHLRGCGKNAAMFDLDQLHFPLMVRNRQDGDRMRPQGLNGSKKVKDMFIDAKIPPGQRERTPLLVDADGTVLWIPGHRRSQRAAIGNHTSRVLFIRAFFE